MQQVVHVYVLGLHRHGPNIFKKVGGMGILLGIAIGMMHPVKDGIGPGIQKGGALRNKGEAVKESLPKLVHFEHLMRSIAVQEKRL